MLLIVVQTEQIQSSEIFYKDIFLKGTGSKLFQWHPLQDTVNIYLQSYRISEEQNLLNTNLYIFPRNAFSVILYVFSCNYFSSDMVNSDHRKIFKCERN